MIVTFGGPPGSGKTAVAKLISEKLMLPMFDIGGMRREAAIKKGMTIEEFNSWADKHHEEGDRYFDNFVKESVLKKKKGLVIGRVAFYLFPESLKIYLDVDVSVGAKRIFEKKEVDAKRFEESASTLAEKIKNVEWRMDNDDKRYHEIYGIHIFDKRNFDVVIDTSNKTLLEVTELVLSEIKKQKN